jgi:hypothetical protein
MRNTLIIILVLGCGATAAAQDPGPRPFVVGELVAASANDPAGPSRMFGFEMTVGGPSWRAVQWFGQGGRIFDVVPGFERAPMMWYGAAGARFATRSLWRFHPYADLSAGVARGDGGIPLAGVALGSQVHLGMHITVDLGYRVQRFFGNADATRARTFLGLGMTF